MAYCERCERFFPHDRALQQHKENSGAHNICCLCSKDFPTFYQLKQHWVASPRHSYCQECNEHFDDDDELEEHYEEEHYYCAICSKMFTTALGLHEHNRQCHHYCPDCRRVFSNENNLRNHQKSSAHVPRTIHCPGRGCNKLFTSGAALILHMESGTCPGNITRRQVDEYLRRHDRRGAITKPERMIEYGTEVKIWATERSWNGRAYECFLCHREFRALDNLNRHFASPVHEEKKYHCPRAYSGCGKEFQLLSSLCQHVENGSCGIRRFNNQFQRHIEDLTNNFKRIAL